MNPWINGKNQLIAASLFLMLIAGAGAQELSGPLTDEEQQLADLINQYRQENGMSAVPVTVSLTQVARAHVSDLNTYHPDTATYGTGDCNRHSWSDHGDWTAVCYTGSQYSQMWNKPSEITDSYRGNGYEIAYWCSSSATPGSAMAEWKGSSSHRDTILEQGDFNIVDWKAMGVAIDGNYAVAWFGANEDPAGEVPAGGHATADNAGLTLSVRKEAYAPGETVEFVLRKSTPGSASLIGAHYDIEKEVSGQWKPYFEMSADKWRFRTPAIDPSLNKGFKWDQRQKGEPDNRASVGTYRIKFYAPEAFEGYLEAEFSVERA